MPWWRSCGGEGIFEVVLESLAKSIFRTCWDRCGIGDGVDTVVTVEVVGDTL